MAQKKQKPVVIKVPQGASKAISQNFKGVLKGSRRKQAILLYPAPHVLSRLQGLHRRAVSGPDSRKLPVARARYAFGRVLSCVMGTYLVLPPALRIKFLGQVLEQADRTRSFDGLVSLYLTGLTGVRQMKDASMLALALSAWDRHGAPARADRGARSVAVFDGQRESIVFVRSDRLRTLGPGGSNRGLLDGIPQQSLTAQMEVRGLMDVAIAQDGEDVCKGVLKVGGGIAGSVGGAVAGGVVGGELGAVTGGISGTSAGVAFGGAVGDVVCGWAFGDEDVTASKTTESHEGGGAAPEESDSSLGERGLEDVAGSGETGSGSGDGGSEDDGSGDDDGDGMPNPDDPDGFPNPDDPHGLQLLVSAAALTNTAACISRVGATLQLKNLPLLAANGRSVASPGYLALSAGHLGKVVVQGGNAVAQKLGATVQKAATPVQVQNLANKQIGQ